METKSKRIKLSRADQYLELYEAFGWELVSQEDLRPDNTILLTMQRDKEKLEDYRRIRKLERQYFHIYYPFPLATIVLLVLGLGPLITYLFVKKTFVYAVSFLYGSLTFFCMAVFAFLVYLIILWKRGKILSYLKKEAANKSGANKDIPTARNILPEDKDSWKLYESSKNS